MNFFYIQTFNFRIVLGMQESWQDNTEFSGTPQQFLLLSASHISMVHLSQAILVTSMEVRISLHISLTVSSFFCSGTLSSILVTFNWHVS